MKKIKPIPRRLKLMKQTIKVLNGEYPELWIEDIDGSKIPPFYGMWTKTGEYVLICRNLNTDLDFMKTFIHGTMGMEYVKITRSIDFTTIQHRQFDIHGSEVVPSKHFTSKQSAERAYQAALMKYWGFDNNIKNLASRFDVKQVEIIRQFKKLK
jgi:hypothetical protein